MAAGEGDRLFGFFNVRRGFRWLGSCHEKIGRSILTSNKEYPLRALSNVLKTRTLEVVCQIEFPTSGKRKIFPCPIFHICSQGISTIRPDDSQVIGRRCGRFDRAYILRTTCKRTKMKQFEGGTAISFEHAFDLSDLA